MVCLGHQVAGLFSNDDQLSKDLFEAGECSYERVWRLPLYQEYRDSMKGDIADLNNVSSFSKGSAGSITAAAFLKEVVPDSLPWAHLDIAGVAYRNKSYHNYVPQYGTGFGVRLLFELLKAYVQSVV